MVQPINSVNSESSIPPNNLGQELRNAIRDNNLEKSKKILENGANPNHLFSNSWGDLSYFMYACYGGHIDLIKFMLQHGGDVNHELSSDYGISCPLSLLISSSYCNPEIMEILNLFKEKGLVLNPSREQRIIEQLFLISMFDSSQNSSDLIIYFFEIKLISKEIYFQLDSKNIEWKRVSCNQKVIKYLFSKKIFPLFNYDTKGSIKNIPTLLEHRMAKTILSMSGFQHDESQNHRLSYLEKELSIGETQGSIHFRCESRILTRKKPESVQPDILRRSSFHLTENYYLLFAKKLAHIFHYEEIYNLNGKKFSLLGFSEVFSIPMLAHELKLFSETNPAFSYFKIISSQLNSTIMTEGFYQKKLEKLAKKIKTTVNKRLWLFASGYDWHSSFTCLFKKHIIIFDRGVGGISFKNRSPDTFINKEFISKISNRHQFNEISHKQFNSIQDSEKKFYKKWTLKPPKLGYCTFSSAKALIRFLIAFRTDTTFSDHSFSATSAAYKSFTAFLRKRNLDDFIERSLYLIEHPTAPKHELEFHLDFSLHFLKRFNNEGSFAAKIVKDEVDIYTEKLFFIAKKTYELI